VLVLSRKKAENVVIDFGGVQVTCTVVELRGDKVRLGFIAPQQVKIHRQEVFDAIQGKEADGE
jgi:carbon storage regulator